MHPLGYDYLDVRDPRPAVRAGVGAVHKLQRRAARLTRRTGNGDTGHSTDVVALKQTLRASGNSAGHDTDVVVLGAGPTASRSPRTSLLGESVT